MAWDLEAKAPKNPTLVLAQALLRRWHINSTLRSRNPVVPRGLPSQLLREQPARLRVRSGSRLLVLDVRCSQSDPLRASAGDHENSSATGFGRWPPLDTFWGDENYPPPSDWQVP